MCYYIPMLIYIWFPEDFCCLGQTKFYIWDRVSLDGPGWLRTGLKVRLPAFVSPSAGIKATTTISRSKWLFKIKQGSGTLYLFDLRCELLWVANAYSKRMSHSPKSSHIPSGSLKWICFLPLDSPPPYILHIRESKLYSDNGQPQVNTVEGETIDQCSEIVEEFFIIFSTVFSGHDTLKAHTLWLVADRKKMYLNNIFKIFQIFIKYFYSVLRSQLKYFSMLYTWFTCAIFRNIKLGIRFRRNYINVYIDFLLHIHLRKQ